MFRPNCSHPVIIVNPSLRTYLQFYDSFSVSDHNYDSPDFHLKVSSLDLEKRNRILCGEHPLKVLNIKSPLQVSSDLEKQIEYASRFSFINSDDGTSLDLFKLVPCGHCEVCQNNYLFGLRQRVLFQLQQVKVVPLFVTFTFKPEKQPLFGPSVDMVQKMRKRLKVLLERRFGVDSSFVKFLCVSEYGHDVNGNERNNLHYHWLVLGMPQLLPNKAKNQLLRAQIFHYIFRQPEYADKKSLNPLSFDEYDLKYPKVFRRPRDYDPYSYGFVNVREVDSSSKAVNYITKYITKNLNNDHRALFKIYDPLVLKPLLSSFPTNDDFKDSVLGRYSKAVVNIKSRFTVEGHRPNFLLVSNNLGVEFAKKLVQRPDGKVAFTDWLSNCFYCVNLSGYFIKKLYPSLSMLVPSSVRKAYYDVVVEIARCLTSSFCTKPIAKMLLNSSQYLVNNYPFYVDSLNDPSFRSDFKSDVDFNTSLMFISSRMSVLYAFIVETDFEELRLKLLERDRYFSKFKSLSEFSPPYAKSLREGQKAIQARQKL